MNKIFIIKIGNFTYLLLFDEVTRKFKITMWFVLYFY